jgi:hypothetical protein
MRFLNADPIGFSGGSNWFAYADGNPISLSDPFGLCASGAAAFVNDGGINAGLDIAQFPFWVADQAHHILNGNWSSLGSGSYNSGVTDALGGLKNPYGNQGHYDTNGIAPTVRDNAIAAAMIVSGVASRGGGTVAANRVGYHATHADVVPLIQQNGFRAGTAPGRLGSGGIYVNSSPQGAIAEFAHHNPGVTPSVLKVQYNPGINASTTVAPRNYVDRLPFNNVDSISAPSVRLPGTTNTNVLNGSLRIIE